MNTCDICNKPERTVCFRERSMICLECSEKPFIDATTVARMLNLRINTFRRILREGQFDRIPKPITIRKSLSEDSNKPYLWTKAFVDRYIKDNRSIIECDICSEVIKTTKLNPLSYFKICATCDKLGLLKLADIAELLNIAERSLAFRIKKNTGNYPQPSYTMDKVFNNGLVKSQNLWEKSVVDKFFKDTDISIKRNKTNRSIHPTVNDMYSKTNLLFNKNISRQLQD